MIVTNYQQAKVRLDHDGIRISFGEVFFFTGLVLWLIQFYISRTIFLELFGDTILTVTRYFCMLIFFAKIVLTESTLHKRAAAVFITAAAVFIVVQQNINTGMPLIQILLMMDLQGISGHMPGAVAYTGTDLFGRLQRTGTKRDQRPREGIP